MSITEFIRAKFFLMRWWSIYEAIYYSDYIGSRCAIWKYRDKELIDQMMATIGIPIIEAK